MLVNILLLHQVLLDILGHEELSDYLALLVPQPAAHHPCSCNKSHSTAKAASTAGSLASQSGGGTLATSHSKGTNSMGMCSNTSVPKTGTGQQMHAINYMQVEG